MDLTYKKIMDKLSKNYEAGIKELEKLGNNNHILSIKELIKIYSEGRYFNLDKKIYWITKHADLGDFESQKFIGEYYSQGHFNHELSIKYLNMAINTNNEYIDAYYFLAKVYSDGNSDLYNLELAKEYHNLANEYNCYYEKISNKVIQLKLTKEEILAKGFTLRDDNYFTLSTPEVEILVDPNNVIHCYDGFTNTTIVAYILIYLKDIFNFNEFELKSYNEVPNLNLYVNYMSEELFNTLKQQGFYFIHRFGDAFMDEKSILISKTQIECKEQNKEGFFLYDGEIGYADFNGNVIVEPQYTKASNCFRDIAVVVKDNTYGVINDSGKYILPLEYDMLEYDCHYKPLALYNEYVYLGYKDGLCYMYNESFELVYEFKSDPKNPDYYMEYKDNVLKYQHFESNKVLLTNLLTKECYEYELAFEEFGIITNKYLYIKSDNNLYIADYNLNIVVNHEFTYISDSFVLKDDKWYLPCESGENKLYLDENMEICEIEIE